MDLTPYSTSFIIFILTFYANSLFGLLISRKQRTAMRQLNDKLNKLRAKKVKTLKQQQEFINMKFPKRQKTQWNIRMVPIFFTPS